MGLLWAGPLLATSVIPITDGELYQRADVIVHGIVLSNDVTVDDRGIPETVTVIEPIAVLKGRLAGSLVIHQLGGTLPDGRFFKMWGRPEYAPGREVVVFAITRPEGEYQTAEMLLGKFEVQQDTSGNMFAVPDLAAGVHPGVEVHARPQALRSAREEDPATAADGNSGGEPAEKAPQDETSPRDLARFLASLSTGVFDVSSSATPSGSLEPVRHAQKSGSATPLWGNISDSMFRWNGATATWTISGTANMDGGGMAEALGALASWTNDPNSNINYVQGTGSSNVLYLNNTTSMLGCGWSTCLTGGGVIGCGGPTGVGGSNVWRGETYTNITQAVAELRASCTHNGFGSVITQSVLTHELGHTLGLGHSDQNVSPHDICRGDEAAATMRATVQSRTTLGTDDQDAIRWLYGDGGTSCTSSVLAVTALSASPALPQPDGRTITWTATATGGTAPVQFRFFLYSASSGWVMVRDYSTANTFSWTPSSSDDGSHFLLVWAKNAGSSAAWDAYSLGPAFDITSSAPLTVTSLTPSPSLPQRAGTTITWTAATSGGTAPVQFRFYLYSVSTGWVMVRNYSTANTFSWTPATSDIGSHTLLVWAKNAGSAKDWDTYSLGPSFEITSSSPLAVTSLTPSPSLPQSAGTTITWTAASSSGTSPVQFRFYVYSASTGWVMVRDYSTANTFSWTPTTSDIGSHDLLVWAKNAGSAKDWDAYLMGPFFNITP